MAMAASIGPRSVALLSPTPAVIVRIRVGGAARESGVWPTSGSAAEAASSSRNSRREVIAQASV
jgi:hypothetical protein